MDFSGRRGQTPLNFGLDPIKEIGQPKRTDRVRRLFGLLLVDQLSLSIDFAVNKGQLYADLSRFGCCAMRLSLSGTDAFGTTAGARPGYAGPAASIGLAHTGHLAGSATAQPHDFIVAEQRAESTP